MSAVGQEKDDPANANPFTAPEYGAIGLWELWHPTKNPPLESPISPLGSRTPVWLQCQGCPYIFPIHF